MHVPCAKYGAFVSQRVAKPHAQERPQALELRVSRTMACSIVLPHVVHGILTRSCTSTFASSDGLDMIKFNTFGCEYAVSGPI